MTPSRRTLPLLLISLATAAACGGTDATISGASGSSGYAVADGGASSQDGASDPDGAVVGGDAATADASDAGKASDGGLDPWSLPPTCSGTTVTATVGRPTDQPGSACIACHTTRGGPRWTFAGTIYPTGHEPTLCTGVNGVGSVTVVLTDTNGATQTLAVNAVGNFFGNATVASPFSAKIVRAGLERASTAPHTAAMGDCNTCHSQGGTSGARGRLVGP
jgi:hypothetical protein